MIAHARLHGIESAAFSNCRRAQRQVVLAFHTAVSPPVGRGAALPKSERDAIPRVAPALGPRPRAGLAGRFQGSFRCHNAGFCPRPTRCARSLPHPQFVGDAASVMAAMPGCRTSFGAAMSASAMSSTGRQPPRHLVGAAARFVHSISLGWQAIPMLEQLCSPLDC